MLLSSIQSKEIIDLSDGKNIGVIIDINITENGNIEELIIQKKKFLFFTGKSRSVKWEEIDKIGKDVILVRANN